MFVTYSLDVSSNILVVPGRVGDNSVTEHLPHRHSKGPHVVICGVLTVLDGFWGHPSDWNSSTVLKGNEAVRREKKGNGAVRREKGGKWGC